MSKDVQYLIDSLVMQSPSGWWLRITDYDTDFYKTKEEAIDALMDILELNTIDA